MIVTKLGGRRSDDGGWVAASTPAELRQGCDEDLRSLRLERIDLVHLRLLSESDVPFLEQLDAMIALQREGKIRHIGLSNVTLEQLEKGVARTAIVSVQNMYSVGLPESVLGDLPFGLAGGQDAIVDWCAARGIVYFPFFSIAVPGPKCEQPALAAVAKAKGVSDAQIAVAWQRARSPVMLPIPGTSSVGHLEENWAARTIRLADDEFAAIAAARTR